MISKEAKQKSDVSFNTIKNACTGNDRKSRRTIRQEAGAVPFFQNTADGSETGAGAIRKPSTDANEFMTSHGIFVFWDMHHVGDIMRDCDLYHITNRSIFSGKTIGSRKRRNGARQEDISLSRATMLILTHAALPPWTRRSI